MNKESSFSLGRAATIGALAAGTLLGPAGGDAYALDTPLVCDLASGKYGCNVATWSWGSGSSGEPVRVPQYAWVGCTARFTTTSGQGGEYQVGTTTSFWQVNGSAWTQYYQAPAINSWFNDNCRGAYQPTSPGGKYVSAQTMLRVTSVTWQRCSTCGPMQSYTAVNTY